jgi:hypothetical protein
MSFDDLICYFSSVNVCMVRVPGIHPNPWHETRKQFYFELINRNDDSRGISCVSPATTTSSDALTSTNTLSHKKFSLQESTFVSSFFQLSVNEDNMKMIFTLHQQDIRCLNSPPYMDMGFLILKVNRPHRIADEYSLNREDYELVYGLGWKLNSRQNQSEEVTLNKGHYLIIPMSTGCKLKQYYEQNPEIVAEIKANMARMKLNKPDASSFSSSNNLSLPSSVSSSIKNTDPVATFSVVTSVVPPLPTSPIPPPIIRLPQAVPVDTKVNYADGPILDFSGDTVKFTPHGTAVYTKIFHQLDKDQNSHLTCDEFNVYWKKIASKPMFPTVFTNSILKNFGELNPSTGAKELRLNGFLEQQLEVIQTKKLHNSYDKLEETIKNEIKALIVDQTPASSSLFSANASALLPPPAPSVVGLTPSLPPAPSAVPARPLVTVHSPPVKGPGDVTPPKAPETVKVASPSTFEATKGVSNSSVESEKPLNFGRSAVLSIHSTSSRYSLETSSYNEIIYHLAEELMILKNGEKTKSYANDKMHLYELNLDYDGLSIMFENADDHKTLSVEVDLAGSNNILTHRDNVKYEALIKPHERAVMFHIVPKETPNGWNSKYMIAYEWK